MYLNSPNLFNCVIQAYQKINAIQIKMLSYSSYNTLILLTVLFNLAYIYIEIKLYQLIYQIKPRHNSSKTIGSKSILSNL